MPEVIRFPNQQAVYEMAVDSLLNDQGETWRMHAKHRLRDMERTARSHWTAKQISDAEEAIGWPKLVTDEEMRELMLLFIRCKARGGKWTEWLRHRNRAKLQQNGVSRQNSYRCIEKCFQEISVKLRNNATLLRDRVA